jgi:hypothetical protein
VKLTPEVPDQRSPAGRSLRQQEVPPTAAPAIAERAITLRLGLATAGSSLAIAIWASAAVLTANRGFDITDEGFYLVSYRWWHTNLRTFTGVQYIYGPVFQALGYNIADLRLVRLLTVLAANLVFGWAFMRWLRVRRSSAPASRLWELSGAAAITACGGMIYGWLPLSPGYNDVSLLGALLAVSIVLTMGTAVDLGRTVRFWLPAALGLVFAVTLLDKWTSSLATLLAVGVAGGLVLAPAGRRSLLRATAWVLAGALLAVGLIQLFVIPLNAAIPQLLATNHLVSLSSNSPAQLLDLYARTGVQLVTNVVTGFGLLLVAAVGVAVAHGKPARWIAGAFAVAAGAFSAWRLLADGALRGGTGNLGRYPVGLVGVLAVAVVVWLAVQVAHSRDEPVRLSESRSRSYSWAVFALLAVFPLTQALGTGNPLYYMAINAFSSWMAIMIAILTGFTASAWPARWLTAAMAAGAVILSATIAANGLWSHPYRTAGRSQDTVAATGVPALSSLRLDPAVARGYRRLHSLLRPYIVPGGRAIMAFDEMPGIVLLLGGRPVGEAWYSAIDDARTAAGIRSQCHGGHGWWGSRDPVLLYNRPPRATDIAALDYCGLNLNTDYRMIAPSSATMGLRIYLPQQPGAGGNRE